MIKRKRKKRNKSSRPQIILSDSYAKKCSIKMEIEYRDRSLSEVYWVPCQTWLNAVH